MPSKADRTAATKAALVQAGRRLFGASGFAATGTTALVAEAGVTRGALYHHFADKAALFRAVYEDVEEEIAGRLLGALGGDSDPLEILRAGVDVFLDACLDPAVQQIALIDGPAVLGWATWREIDATYGLGLLIVALRVAVDDGVIETQPVEPLAHILLGALVEAGMFVAHAEDQKAARHDVGAALVAMLDGLRRPPLSGR